MKKKEKIILGTGFLQKFSLRTKDFYEILIPIKKSRKMYCYCKKGCSCKPWKVILER